MLSSKHIRNYSFSNCNTELVSCCSYYSNSVHKTIEITNKLNFIDLNCIEALKINEDLRVFISYSLNYIAQQKIWSHILLQHFMLEESEPKIRLTFYFQKKIKISQFEEEMLLPENKVFKHLSRQLFFKTRELKDLLVLDERIF